MFGFTYHLTELNTLTIVKATKNDAKEYCFTNLCEVIKNLEKQGFKVLTKFDN